MASIVTTLYMGRAEKALLELVTLHGATTYTRAICTSFYAVGPPLPHIESRIIETESSH